MGGNQSGEQLPTLPHNQSNLVLSNQNLTHVPVKIPRKNKLLTLDLSNNVIHRIPTKMKKLEKLIIQRNNLNSIPPQFAEAFSHMKHLQQLDLSYNGIETLPDFITEIPHLKRLEVGGNKLSELPHFPPGLELVDLSQNRFDKIPKLPSTIFAVVYNYNRIEMFDPFLPNVHHIFCSMNRIATFKTGLAFSHLLTLDLSMNLITSEKVPNFRMFSPCLQKLDLSLNQLTIFPDVPATLKELNLNYNQITDIPDIDESLPILDVLKLTNNLVEQVGKLPASLTSVYLSENKIKTIKEAALNNLQVLQLHCNEFEEPPKLGAIQVKDVFLMSNKLTSFELEDIFVSQQHTANNDNDNDNSNQSVPKMVPTFFDPLILTRINLSNNNLERINPNLFDLPNLIYLNVEKNKLKKLPRLVSLSKILFLNISENPFERLKFDLPISIMTFYCSSCNLKEIPDSITDCISLSILFCMDNEIESLPELPSIGMLNASNNKLKKFPQLPKCIKQLDLSMNEIEELPSNLNEYDGLIELDMSYNKLSKLPDIQNLTSLLFLKFAHNENLKGKIELDAFRLLETFDISFTRISINQIPVESIRELIVSFPSEAAKSIENTDSEEALIFTYPQVKVMTESDFVAFAEMRGSRETMEDALIARPFICRGCDVYAILDGHGGTNTSNYGVFKIAELFMQNDKITAKNGGSYGGFDSPASEGFVRQIVKDLVDSLRTKYFIDGATMGLAVFSGTTIVAANLGDTRILLIGEDGTIKFSTRDHKPIIREEIERILSVGGRVSNERVDGVLAISRCLGDFGIHGVSYEPDIIVKDFDEEDDRWLVLCCDGVFDVITNEDVGMIAKDAESASELAYRLRNVASVRLSTDNISAMAVDLKARNAKASKIEKNNKKKKK
ncbi:hypothetical protein M9Y10_010948 [Tritrichomonas musculus]|uniref:PPM-type phosphatase domain-containing protein n=1 Tax=Tritrichomonas musculus TaxID=1915356 RepID=A0ABR2INC2_9EUKA